MAVSIMVGRTPAWTMPAMLRWSSVASSRTTESRPDGESSGSPICSPTSSAKGKELLLDWSLTAGRPSQNDDTAQDVARGHPPERLLHVAEPDGLADECVQRQSPLEVQVDEHREVAGGQAVAVPGRLERAAAAEQVDQRHLDAHVGRGDPDQ